MKKLIFTALMMFTAAASASDAFRYKNLGFSRDGRYYAFVQSVTQDGSGFPSANGQVIDVAANNTVVLKNVIIQDENASEKQAVEDVIAQLQLATYGIDGSQPGQTLWVRFPTDLSPAVQQALFSTQYGVDEGAGYLEKFRLDLTEVQAPKNSGNCYFEDKATMITLSLTDIQNHARRDLQVDSRVPASRGCPSGYQIRQVIRFQNSIATVLRYKSPGFEGPDLRHMVVTGANALR